jgi:hypothetical protein
MSVNFKNIVEINLRCEIVDLRRDLMNYMRYAEIAERTEYLNQINKILSNIKKKLRIKEAEYLKKFGVVIDVE